MANNINQGAAYIMGSDKVSVNDAQGSDKLYREGLEFTTETKSRCINTRHAKEAN